MLVLAAFWSVSFSLFQNILIFFASLIVLLGTSGALWAAWGTHFAGGNWEHWR